MPKAKAYAIATSSLQKSGKMKPAKDKMDKAKK
jgi:hypothetical protein